MKHIFMWVTLALCFLFSNSKPLTSENVVIAIDCGSNMDYQSPDGFTYVADTYYSGDSRTADYTFNHVFKNNPLKFTDDPIVYSTERHGEGFSYSLPLDGKANYTLILQLVEVFFEEKDQRVFDILFGDAVVRKDFSILDHVPGKVFVHFEYIAFEWTGEQIITDDGLVCPNAYSPENNRLNVQFRRGKRDLPKIDALVLVKDKLHDTNYDDHQAFIQNWDKYAQEQKENAERTEAALNKNEPIESYELDQEESDGLLALMFSWIGLTIYLVLGAFLVCLYALDGKQKAKKEI